MINLIDLSDAFLQVKENRGCAGVDGVTIEEFELDLKRNLARLHQELKAKSYLPLPLLKILVDKGDGTGTARKLCIPAVRDRVAQTAVLHLIEPILEKEFEECSFAFRKGRSVQKAIHKIQEYYDRGFRWVVDADIDAFFDSVNHDQLMAKVGKYIKHKEIVRLINLWIKAEVWNGDSIEIINTGIPQGSPLSPILSNLFLDELDEAMLQNGQKFVRYADDFVILCKSPDKAKDALELTEEVLHSLSLKLDEADIVSFDHGFRYLGVTFVRSMSFSSSDKSTKEKKVLFYPPPLNLPAYFSQKKRRQR